MIESVHVNNYKGIKNLKLDKLNRINIFIGKNNSGKTSLLEATYIGARDNYFSLMNVLYYRNLELDDKTMKTLFYNLDSSNAINIVLEQDKKEVKTNIMSNIQGSFTLRTNILNPESFSHEKIYSLKQTMEDQINDLTFNFEDSEKDKGAILNIRDPKTNEIMKTSLDLSKLAYFTSKFNVDTNFAKTLKEEIKSKKVKNKIVKELKNFDSNIDDILVDEDNIEVYLRNIDTPFPIEAMGSGSMTILKIASILSNENIETIFIDEIEEGLHISSMKSVAEYIARCMDENPKLQIFITTHSKEIINLISQVQTDVSIVSAYRLYTKGKETKVVEYTDDLLETLEEGWEIR